MAKPQLSNPLNIVIGSGQVLLGFENASGDVDNFSYKAQSSITINVSANTVDVPDEDSPTAETIVSVADAVTRGGQLTIKDWDDELKAAFLLGSASTFSQAATPVVDEACVLKVGSYVYFGKSASNPTGAKNVSAVVITTSDGLTTYAEGTDYLLEADKGRAFILPTFTGTDGEAGLADYTPAAETRNRVASGGLTAKTAWLIFDSDYSNGKAENIEAPKVKLIPNGDITLKDRQNPRAMVFDLKFETRAGYPQLIIDGAAS